MKSTRAVVLMLLFHVLLGSRFVKGHQSVAWELLNEHHTELLKVTRRASDLTLLGILAFAAASPHHDSSDRASDPQGKPEYDGLESYDSAAIKVVNVWADVTVHLIRFVDESEAAAFEVDLRGAKRTQRAQALIRGKVFGVSRRQRSLLVVACEDGGEAGYCNAKARWLQAMIPLVLERTHDTWPR